MRRQHWTVARRQVSHPAAAQRWDRAYQLLLSAPAADSHLPSAGTPERNHHARSPLRPGIDAAPSPGANH
jgi:hypothetical protein